MRINETPEHKQIKIHLQESLRSWLDGADIAEYPHSGQEVDVFQVLYSGTTILVEIIWNTGYTHFLEDLDIIQNSTARVKIVVVNPAIFSKEKYVHHFDKTRIAEIVNLSW